MRAPFFSREVMRVNLAIWLTMAICAMGLWHTSQFISGICAGFGLALTRLSGSDAEEERWQ